MLYVWKSTGDNRAADGTHTITYEANGCPLIVQSRRRPIPHANGKGTWLHTSYWVLNPVTGEEKEYYRLRLAQRAAEEGDIKWPTK